MDPWFWSIFTSGTRSNSSLLVSYSDNGVFPPLGSSHSGGNIFPLNSTPRVSSDDSGASGTILSSLSPTIYLTLYICIVCSRGKAQSTRRRCKNNNELFRILFLSAFWVGWARLTHIRYIITYIANFTTSFFEQKGSIGKREGWWSEEERGNKYSDAKQPPSWMLLRS